MPKDIGQLSDIEVVGTPMRGVNDDPNNVFPLRAIALSPRFIIMNHFTFLTPTAAAPSSLIGSPSRTSGRRQ